MIIYDPYYQAARLHVRSFDHGSCRQIFPTDQARLRKAELNTPRTPPERLLAGRLRRHGLRAAPQWSGQQRALAGIGRPNRVKKEALIWVILWA